MPISAPLLLVEDDNSVRSTLTTFLDLEGYTVEAVSSTRAAMEKLAASSYPIVISDIYLDERTGLDVLKAAKEAHSDCRVILMSARGSMETVMAATRGGAFEYLAKPFELDDLLSAIQKAEAEIEGAGNSDRETDIDDLPETEMIGSSTRMIEIYKTLSQVAPTDATVLITGETGTGKELVARMIHSNSKRLIGPFVPVDCGSIAPSLLEAELFGALKGSYTGADRDRTGVFETANRGTVFLDEIGEIDGAFQLKLLRFLQEREIRPVGANRAKPVDVRIVAATNKDLQKLVEEGKFREDLWFRLNVVRIPLPALRDRRTDIPLLSHFFLRKYNERYELSAVITTSGLKLLEEQPWPGNVRQLQHLIERLVILSPHGRIDAEAVADALVESSSEDPTTSESLRDTEREQILKVLEATSNNKSRAAKILGIERKTLYRKLERMGIA
ncbi:MAG: sigma-54-dependent Fis family transcriptional regulator [Acidobacteria bacterium]|nr:sigma-54-dependent Fis family transcriptional regulator [Acidobacteriota bacterium]